MAEGEWITEINEGLNAMGYSTKLKIHKGIGMLTVVLIDKRVSGKERTIGYISEGTDKNAEKIRESLGIALDTIILVNNRTNI